MFTLKKPDMVDVKYSCFHPEGYDPKLEEIEAKLKSGELVDSRERMGKAEQETYIRLVACTDMLLDMIENADKWRRLQKIPRGVATLKTCVTLLRKINNETARLSPALQMLQLRKTMPFIKVHVYSKGVQTIDPHKDDGRWMSFEDINIMMTAVRNECMMCTITDPKVQKKCMYRQVLDKLPIDRPENVSGCGYMEVLG